LLRLLLILELGPLRSSRLERQLRRLLL